MVNLGVLTMPKPTTNLSKMAPSSAGILAALNRAREEKMKELSAIFFVTEKLLRTVEDIEKSLEVSLERKVGK